MSNIIRVISLFRNVEKVSRNSYMFQTVPVHVSSRGKTTYTPRRAILYVPGHDKRKIRKIASLDVDCVVLDCEDGVAANKKDEARQGICEMVKNIEFGRSEYAVRVNSVDSGLAAEDLSVLLKADKLPDSIMIPKVDSVEHVEWINQQLCEHLQSFSLAQKINLILFVESAKSLLDLREICKKTIELSHRAPFMLAGLVFGSDDFCADIGATRTPDAIELLMARQQIVLIAKAFRLQAIDIVFIDYKDLEGLKKQSKEGANMGFTGKQIIHPGQVSIVQDSFTPSLEKIEWAKELVHLFKEHQQHGKGAFTFRGAMIDRPLLLQAENILHLAEVLKSKSSS